MLVYIIKSVACLAILLVFYKLFLEKESVHQFKRFYLLGALVFSLIVPALVFTEYIEAAPVEATTYIADQQPIQITQDVIDIPPALEADVLDIEPILWGIYFLGLIFFGLKFIRNLFQIFNRIRKNPKHKLTRFTQVLLQEKITPHTFLSYIFLNKSKFEANEIPKEVLLHEETHAHQKHSLDVILIELLQVIFWVNPFIYLTKKAIKLNHEFLADHAVLKNNIDKSTYQNTLLSYLSPDSEKKYQPLANAINYSSIKKRFTVMKTHTSKKGILLRSLLLLPLLTILLYGFSETKAVQKEINTYTNIDHSLNTIKIYINEKQEITIEGEIIKIESISEKLSQIIKSSLIKTNLSQEIYIEAEGILNIKLLESIKEQIKKAGGILTMVTADTIKVMKTTFEEKYSGVSFSARDTIYIKLENGESILGVSTKENSINSKTNITPKINQDGASRKLMIEYNALAKKYNTMLSKSKSIQIKKKDVDRLEYIYKLMSKKQKENAAPFPDFPPLPKSPIILKGEKSNIPPPPPPKAPKVKKYGEIDVPPSPAVLNYRKIDANAVEEVIANQEIYDEVGNNIYSTIAKKRPVKNFPDGVPNNNDRMNYYRGKKGDLIAINVAKPPKSVFSKKIATENSVKYVKEQIQQNQSGTTSHSYKQKKHELPAAPKIAYRIIKEKPLSNNLKKLVKNYSEKSKIYRNNAITYINHNGGNRAELDIEYKKLLELHQAFKIKAKEEGLFAQPDPANSPIIAYSIPPKPPIPQNPIDHIIEMAKKNAKFLYEGKEITSDKAIKLLKENNKINVDSRSSTLKIPVVKLSTKPIVFDK